MRTHYIGQLQSKKANAVTRWADVVQSVDRPKIVDALARGAGNAGRELTVLVQVDLDPDPAEHRGGAQPADVPALWCQATLLSAGRPVALVRETVYRVAFTGRRPPDLTGYLTPAPPRLVS